MQTALKAQVQQPPDLADLVFGATQRAKLEAALEDLSLSPGNRHEILNLAKRVAMQGLRQPFEFGTKLEARDRPGHVEIFVGSKPSGYEEDPIYSGRRRRSGRPGFRMATDPLVWTVDGTGRRQGVAQGTASSWKVA
jgi:hypothetical protein